MQHGLVFTSKRFTVTVWGRSSSSRMPQQQIGIPRGLPSVVIERLFRTMKEQCIWLRRFQSLDEAKSVIGRWVDWYNHQRPHQALKMKTTAEMYKLAA